MSDSLTEQVRNKYASAAASALSSEHAGVRAVAEAFGYSPEELLAIPAGANLGLSFRILKPGGRVAVSDIALKKPLPEALRESLLAYVGCIAGAILMAEYETGLRQAGFDPVEVIDTAKDLNVYAKVENQAGCCSPAMASSSGLPVIDSCCGTEAPSSPVHEGLSDVL